MSAPHFHWTNENPSGSNLARSLSARQPGPDGSGLLKAPQFTQDGDPRSFEMPSYSSVPSSSPYSIQSRQISHLPTPQSPKTKPYHSVSAPITPESPTNAFQLSQARPPSSLSIRQTEESHMHSLSSQQMLTPESSPFMSRTLQYSAQSRSALGASEPSMRAGSPPTSLAPAHQITPPLSSPSWSSARSRLSSPFMDKLTLNERPSQTRSRSPGLSESLSVSSKVAARADGVFAADPAHTSPPLSPPFVAGPSSSGGEMERLRLQMLEEKAAMLHEAENRRPDYLKREKRPRPDSDSAAILGEVDMEDRIGIAMSPMKGRRLKLFQETSEESFEESLMAGGYGRYRTFDWGMEPSRPDHAKLPKAEPFTDLEVIVTHKELKKRKRLEAFRHAAKSPATTRLYPVEITGKGRVLLDVAGAAQDFTGTALSKKRNTRRKKKGAPEESMESGKSLATEPVEAVGPNWPDAEFPWRVRKEERAKLAQAEEDEKLRWIEKFLDRDTDEEDEYEASQSSLQCQIPGTSHSPSRRGQRKTQSLGEGHAALRMEPSAFYSADPADAQATLKSKKSIRAVVHRYLRRTGKADGDDDDVICSCQHRDEGGSDCVQCDDCHKWYHLRCAGIASISELGREEDPWYCPICSAKMPSDFSPFEPILVPTYNEPPRASPYDLPFFQGSLQDSPMAPWAFPRPPQTPTRGGSGVASYSSGKPGPTTPHTQDVRAHFTPGSSGGLAVDEPLFDPTSTPSRGIKFPGAFTTPKNTMWNARIPFAFHTPSRSGRSGTSRLHNTVPYEDTGGNVPSSPSPYRSVQAHDDSPIRRAQPDAPRIALSRTMWESPLGVGSQMTSSPPALARDRVRNASDPRPTPQ